MLVIHKNFGIAFGTKNLEFQMQVYTASWIHTPYQHPFHHAITTYMTCCTMLDGGTRKLAGRYQGSHCPPCTVCHFCHLNFCWEMACDDDDSQLDHQLDHSVCTNVPLTTTIHHLEHKKHLPYKITARTNHCPLPYKRHSMTKHGGWQPASGTVNSVY